MHMELDKKRILEWMDCKEDSPVYEEISEELDDFLEEAEELLQPDYFFRFGKWERQDLYAWDGQVIYAGVTVGKKICEKSSTYFQQGDYLSGMMADAVADEALMQTDAQLLKEIRKTCMEQNLGITGRLEAPLDFPMETQKVIVEQLDIPIQVTENFMLEPVKSICYVFRVEKDRQVYCLEHDCRKCSRKDCKMRKEIKGVFEINGITYEKNTDGKRSLLEEFLSFEEKITVPCGGKGICGKCRMQVLEGTFKITPEDEKFFKKEELAKGLRLACKAVPEGDFKVKWLGALEEEMEVLGNRVVIEPRQKVSAADGQVVIGIDIGTTTLAFSAYEINSEKVVMEVAGLNHQRSFGADVIARIQASNEGQKAELQKSIQRDLLNGMRALCLKGNLAPAQIKKVVLAGNTTMIHLLMGYSCETLGVVPFTPYNLEQIETDMNTLCETFDMPFETVIMPGISTFVGGDITAGIMAVEMYRKEKPCLFIDLGTNGEMAIGNRDKILVTSTAAGPAFEGGNISCGVGSIPGAICHVKLEGDKEIGTIGNKPPVGICGTGVVETTAQLIKTELLDETGLLDEDYFEEGYPLAEGSNGEVIHFTQKDVREIQLAKAAVRAGLETLMLRYGTTCEELEAVYVAGGFGYKLNLKEAVAIGMFPEKLLSKMQAAGNTSLEGAKNYGLGKFTSDDVEKMRQVTEEISLGNDKDFQEFYMEYMMFEAD